jgi:hypothetical protein
MASFRLFAGSELSLGTVIARRSRSPRKSSRGAAGPRPRRDADDVVLAVREGSGGRSRLTAQRTFLRTAAGRLPCRLRRPMGPALPRSVAIWLRSPADAYLAGQIGSHR